jgi:hypothetical protein
MRQRYRSTRMHADRHHVRPDRRGLALPGGYDRHVFATAGGLVDERDDDESTGVDELAMAVTRHCPGDSLMSHSDRGI